MDQSTCEGCCWPIEGRQMQENYLNIPHIMDLKKLLLLGGQPTNTGNPRDNWILHSIRQFQVHHMTNALHVHKFLVVASEFHVKIITIINATFIFSGQKSHTSL